MSYWRANWAKRLLLRVGEGEGAGRLIIITSLSLQG